MKSKLILFFVLCALPVASFADSYIEAEFETRFRAVIALGDASPEMLHEIWLYGDTPEKEFRTTQESIVITMKLGAEDLELVDITPAIKEKLAEPVVIDGVTYHANLKPYKMFKISFADTEPGGPKGWSYVVGEKDGKLYMMGLKKDK